jgi:hypothetical protein
MLKPKMEFIIQFLFKYSMGTNIDGMPFKGKTPSRGEWGIVHGFYFPLINFNQITCERDSIIRNLVGGNNKEVGTWMFTRAFNLKAFIQLM